MPADPDTLYGPSNAIESASAGAVRAASLQRARERMDALRNARADEALRKQVQEHDSTLRSLRGAGGTKVNLPIISHSGKGGDSVSSLRMVIVIDGVVQFASFPGVLLG